MKAFLQELRRRKVIQVAAAYLLVAWLLMQVADVMFPSLGLPEWTVTLVVALLILGFPLALILSWAYELSSSGLQREAASDDVHEGTGFSQSADKSIGVLPFIDLSPDKDQEYFSDGLTEELLNALARVKDLRVSSRTSSFAFRGSSADIPTVANKLGVNFVVEGSVRKAGDHLRITAQLIEAASDSHIWSQTYDRNLDDIFVIQDDIARQIAGALQIELMPQPISEATTDDVQAYDYYLRGRSNFSRLGKDNIRRAIRMFKQATHIDPDFAQAWAGLAMAHAYCVILFDSGAGDMLAAEEASNRAIELDPNLAESYAARIMVYAATSQFEDAENAFRRAVELDPANFDAYYQFGRLQFKRGKRAEAVSLFQRASDIDPTDYQSSNLSVPIYKDLGDDEKALAAARRGIKAAELHIKQQPGNARAYLLGAGSLMHLGERDKALRFAESAQRVDPDSEDTNYNAACFYANAGELEKALDCLDKGLHDPDWMDNDVDLNPLRDHPRFKKMMKRLRHG